MSEFNIEVQGGSSVRLPTAGKYCEKDIIVTASGGGGGTEEIENIIDESGVLDSTDGITTTVTEKVEQLIDKADVLKKATGISFFNSNIETITLDCSNFTILRSAFQSCAKLKEVFLSNTQKVVEWGYTFYTVGSLTTIETLDLSGLTNRSNWVMAGVGSLRIFKVVPETISVSISIPAPKLNVESIQSIIDGLATVETAQTLTLHKDAKILQSQVDSANAKGWTVAGGIVVSEEEYYG